LEFGGVLSKLDVILIMEDLSEHLPQLRAVFGWDVDLNQNPWHSHWHRIPKNVPVMNFSPLNVYRSCKFCLEKRGIVFCCA